MWQRAAVTQANLLVHGPPVLTVSSQLQPGFVVTSQIEAVFGISYQSIIAPLLAQLVDSCYGSSGEDQNGCDCRR
jgi:hypothetical protein